MVRDCLTGYQKDIIMNDFILFIVIFMCAMCCVHNQFSTDYDKHYGAPYNHMYISVRSVVWWEDSEIVSSFVETISEDDSLLHVVKCVKAVNSTYFGGMEFAVNSSHEEVISTIYLCSKGADVILP